MRSHCQKNPIKGHTVWVTRMINGIPRYIITTKESSRDYYYLYCLVDGEYTKIARAKSPVGLERYMEGSS